MTRYLARYLDGDAEEITADLIERSGSDYVVYRERQVVGYVPSANVRSILLQDDTKAVKS